MKKVIAHLKSAAPYSQSRQFEREAPKAENEGADQYENRCWRLRAHTDSTKITELKDKGWAREGHIIIPGIVFHRVTIEAQQRRKDVIPGKGKKTYLDSFRAGLMVSDDLVLPIKGDKVEGEWVSCDPRGRPGGRGVWRCFPLIPEWEGKVEFTILEDILLQDSPRKKPIFIENLRTAGQFGIGRWRPIKSGGRYGRFGVVDYDIVELEEEEAA